MSKSILGSFIIVWLVFCCINVSAQEDVDINDVKAHRIKRKVADYHPFLKDEKLTPEMQSLLIEVLRLERRKRALHKTKKKFRQFRNNSIYYSPVKSQKKTKKFLGTVEIFTLPTTRLDSVDDSTVSLITKPMSFWIKPLSSDRDYIKQRFDKNGNLLDLNYSFKNPKQQLLNSKKNAELEVNSDKEDEDAINSDENRNEGLSPEIQGIEDVLGLESSKEGELNNLIENALKGDDADTAYANITNSKKREIRFPLAIQSVTRSFMPIPMNINREVSVLTKPSFYWLNQNKQFVNNLLLKNSAQPEASNFTAASNISSVPSNPRIIYYTDSSPIQSQLESNSAPNSSVNQNAKPSVGRIELTPLEALGLNRSAPEAININKEVSLTTKPPQYWLDMWNMTNNASQNSAKSDLKLKKDANTTATTTPSLPSVNTTEDSLVAKPINISAEISLLTKPSHYWTDQYIKNTTESTLNVSVTQSIVLDGFTDRVKMMAVNLSNVISMTNKPASEWINVPQARFGSSNNEMDLNPRQNISEHKQDGRGFNQLASVINATKQYPANFVQTTNKGDLQNQSSFHNVSSSNVSLVINTKAASASSPLRNEYQNKSESGRISKSVDNYGNMSVIRQPYAINEVPKIYFQQRETNKTKEPNQNNSQNPSTISNFAQNVSRLVNVTKDSLLGRMDANSLQGQFNNPQVADLSMPKILPQHLFNNSPVAQPNLNMNPINFQNEATMDKDPVLPHVFYTGALSEFNGYKNDSMQNNGRNNFTASNENSLAHEEPAANISTGNSFNIGDFPKTSFLNETKLIKDLETPKLVVQYNFSNANAIESPQFHNNAIINQNPPQFNQENVRNTSMNQNNVIINEDPKRFYQAESNYNGNKIGPQFKNNSIDGANFIESLAANSSLTKNMLLTNETHNNMLSKDNIQPYVNVLPIQSPASLKNISVIESSFSNSATNNQMFNDASSSQFQGPSSFVNNSLAIKPYSSNEANSQMVNNSQLQDQRSSLINNSVARNPFSTNETSNQINLSQIQHRDENNGKEVNPPEQASSSQFQGPSSFVNNSLAIKPYSSNEANSQMVNNSQLQDQRSSLINNSVARNPFSTNETSNQINLSQIQRRDENKGKEVKPPEQTQNTALTNGNTLGKETMIKTLKDSITMTFKNTTENLNKAQKRDTYYERFGEQEPSYSDEYVPPYYGKREKLLNIHSDDKEYHPHKYRKRIVRHIEADEDLENIEGSNSNSLLQLEDMKCFKRKKSVPSDRSEESDKDEEDRVFHKIIKRAYPIFNYEDEPEEIDTESIENDEQDVHKSIKRESPVIDKESDYQENPENIDFESNIGEEGAAEKRGSILKESLKSRSDSIEMNKDGSDMQLDPNLENPMFQKFLRQYISNLASNGRKSRSNVFGGITKLPTLVEAMQKYIRSSYAPSTTTPIYSKLPSTDLSTNQLDIIDMNSLLRTVDVLSTVDRYGYAIEEPPRTKPSTEIEPYFDFRIVTKIPFLLKSSPLHLAVNNINSDYIIREKAKVTPSLAYAIVKMRAAGASNFTTADKLSKKFALVSKKDCAKNDIGTDLLSFRNFLKNYYTNENLPCDSFRDIFDTVNDIRLDKFGRSSGSVSGMSCNFNGSWLSTVAGMRIDLNQTDSNTFSVSLASKIPPPAKGGLLYTENCTDWLLSARIPMKKTSIIQVTGINEMEKKLAVFLGECRVCNDKNLVYGHWIVLRESRDCEDIFSTQESYTDIWRQEGLHTLRLHNLQMLKMSLTTTEKPSVVAMTTHSGDVVTLLEGNVTISIANGTIAIIGGLTGGVPAPADTITSIRPDGGGTVIGEGGGATVITGVVPPVITGMDGEVSVVASTAATNAVNIVVGKKSIAIKL